MKQSLAPKIMEFISLRSPLPTCLGQTKNLIFVSQTNAPSYLLFVKNIVQRLLQKRIKELKRICIKMRYDAPAEFLRCHRIRQGSLARVNVYFL